ncbi:hypothetical protein MSIBF_A230002 [groundwater metagenome]|uniref:Asparagine synthetase domain-containing protein n=1 Tax=groundwater metagenome TaxID=717931 RepID=A0A098EA82_9ZZZZ
MKELLNIKFLEEFKNNEKFKVIDNLSMRSYEDLMNGGIQSLLRYEDRNSMAFSIESRVPFLDYRITEYVFTLPLNQRIKNGWTKYILRNSMKNILPEKIRKRRSKIGFAAPDERWLKENKNKILEIFKSESFKKRKYFNQELIINKFNELCDVGQYDSDILIFWRIINLEMWMRVFVDKDENIYRPL